VHSKGGGGSGTPLRGLRKAFYSAESLLKSGGQVPVILAIGSREGVQGGVGEAAGLTALGATSTSSDWCQRCVTSLLYAPSVIPNVRNLHRK